MKLEDVKMLLKESNAVGIFNLNVPSLKEEFPCKQMLVGHRKTITKISMTSEDNANYNIALLGLLSELCPTMPIEKLTCIDFISVISQLRMYSIDNKITLNITCPECECKFIHTIHFENIINNCQKYELKEKEYSKQLAKGLEIKFKIGEASALDNITFGRCRQLLTENNELSRSESIKNGLYLYPIQFIKQIFINGEEIEDFPNKQFMERFTFIMEDLPSTILDNKESNSDDDKKSDKNIFMDIYNSFPIDRFNSLYETIECPQCKHKMEGVYTYDNFFVD